MLALALMIALSGPPDAQDRLLQAVSTAAERHDECIEASARKFIASNEPADVVASAAMWECSGRYMDLFEAGVAYLTASSTSRSPQEVRREEFEKLPRDEATRRERAIYFVVTTRMGLSPNMPHESYNSRQ